jgi:HAMP domain-containing protein
MGTGQTKTSIKWKILGGILVIEILLTVVFAIIVINTFQRNLQLSSTRAVANIQGMYDSIMRNDTKMLSAALDVFLQNESFTQVYSKKDRKMLLSAVEALYRRNRDLYGMTHFYYINNDGKCFLRVHKPELFGDPVNRVTLLQAKSTGRVSSGIELGKTAFALRVVSPCIYKGNQIGFVEFGEEIDHFDQIVKKETGSDVFVIVQKTLFNENDYRGTRKTANQRDDWDDLKNYALVSETSGDRGFFVSKILTEGDIRSIQTPTFLGTVTRNGRTLAKGAFPLHDVANKQVGAIMTLTDVTELMNTEKMALTYLILASIVLFLVSYWFTFRYLKAVIIDPLINLSLRADEISMGKVEEKLETDRTDEIGMLIRSFDRMRVSLNKFLTILSKG